MNFLKEKSRANEIIEALKNDECYWLSDDDKKDISIECRLSLGRLLTEVDEEKDIKVKDQKLANVRNYVSDLLNALIKCDLTFVYDILRISLVDTLYYDSLIKWYEVGILFDFNRHPKIEVEFFSGWPTLRSVECGEISFSFAGQILANYVTFCFSADESGDQKDVVYLFDDPHHEISSLNSRYEIGFDNRVLKPMPKKLFQGDGTFDYYLVQRQKDPMSRILELSDYGGLLWTKDFVAEGNVLSEEDIFTVSRCFQGYKKTPTIN